MERWAKTVNAAKSVQQQQLHAVIEQERTVTQPQALPTHSSASSVAVDPVNAMYDFKKSSGPLLSEVMNLVRGHARTHTHNVWFPSCVTLWWLLMLLDS